MICSRCMASPRFTGRLYCAACGAKQLAEETWVFAPTSCADGGQFAWLRVTDGAMEMVGCACHHCPPKEAKVEVQ